MDNVLVSTTVIGLISIRELVPKLIVVVMLLVIINVDLFVAELVTGGPAWSRIRSGRATVTEAMINAAKKVDDIIDFKCLDQLKQGF